MKLIAYGGTNGPCSILGLDKKLLQNHNAVMLQDAPVTPTLPMTDLQKSKDFYENKLGLKLSTIQTEADSLLFEAGKGTHIYLYKRGPSKAEHTLASLTVENIDAEVDELTKKGVVFEHYDMSNGIKTNEKGIAAMGSSKAAWFKDPDGNILSILQMGI